jgi:hypothetical protein
MLLIIAPVFGLKINKKYSKMKTLKIQMIKKFLWNQLEIVDKEKIKTPHNLMRSLKVCSSKHLAHPYFI